MASLNLYDLLGKRALIARGSARAIQEQISDALVDGQSELVLDFKDVLGVSPSFFDETLRIVEECIAEAGGGRLRVTIEEPPTELSSKFLAVGRAHGLSVSKAADGSWVISNGGDGPAQST